MGSIRWSRVALGFVGAPVVAAAGIGVAAVVGELAFRALLEELWRLVAYHGTRIGYGAVTFGSAVVAYMAGRKRTDRWWLRHGEHIADGLLRDRIDEVRRQRDAAVDRVAMLEESLRVKQAQIRAAHEAAAIAAADAGRVQLALTALPAANGHHPMRRLN